MPPPPRSARRAAGLLLVLEALVVLLLAVRTTGTTPVFGSGDEGYHLDYAASLAEGRGIPVVGVTPVRPEVRAVQADVPVDQLPPPPPVLRFGDTSYEAFQPPLYYALVAPLVLLSDDVRTRIALLRGAGVALVALAAGLLWLLCRELRPDRARLLYALALLPLLGKAFREQVLLVSNDVLLLPLSVLLALVGLRAVRSGSLRWFAAAAVVVGLLLLTKLTSSWSLLLLLAMAVPVLRRAATRRRQVGVLALLGVPALLLSPWLLLNLQRYGALTATDVVTRLQVGVTGPLAPVGVLDQLRHLPDVALQLLLGRRDPHPPAVEVAALLLGCALVLLAAAGPALRRVRRDGGWVLLVPLPLQVLVFSVVTVLSGTQVLYERYLHPAAVLAVVGVAAALLPSGARSAVVGDVVLPDLERAQGQLLRE